MHEIALASLGPRDCAGIPFDIVDDDSGRVIRGPEFAFVYDARGRLAAALNDADADGQLDDLAELYLYDADGRLIHIERPQTGEAETYAYDGEHMVTAVNGAAEPIWEAVWGPKQDQLIEWHDFAADDWFTIVRDHRNSVVSLLSRNEGYVGTASYTPEGRLTTYNHDTTVSCAEPGTSTTVCPGLADMPFAFNSMWRSPISGLSYMCRERSDQMPLGCATAGTPRRWGSSPRTTRSATSTSTRHLDSRHSIRSTGGTHSGSVTRSWRARDAGTGPDPSVCQRRNDGSAWACEQRVGRISPTTFKSSSTRSA